MASKSSQNGKYTKTIEIVSKEMKETNDVILSTDSDKDLKELAEDVWERFLSQIKRKYADNSFIVPEVKALHNLGVSGVFKDVEKEKNSLINALFDDFRKTRDELKQISESKKMVAGAEISTNAQALIFNQQFYEDFTDAIHLEGKERIKKISDVLQLDYENQVEVTYKTRNGVESELIPESIINKYIKNKGKDYVTVKVKDGKKFYLTSKENFNVLKKETERPFTESYAERLLGNSEKGDIGQIQRNIKKYQALVEKEEQDLSSKWALNYIKNHPGKTVDEYLEIVRQHLKKELRDKAQKDKIAIQKKAKEMRDFVLRQAQKANRSKYRSLEFSANINVGEVPNFDKIVDKVISDTRSKIDKYRRLAIIGTDQRLVESSKIHLTAENMMFDEYSANGNRFTRKTGYKSKKEVMNIAWYKKTVGLTINLLPEIEADEFKIVGYLRPAYVNSSTSTWNEKTKNGKIKHEVDFGCLLAATYFYTLVANTPIDEEYKLRAGHDDERNLDIGEKYNKWRRKRIAVKLNEKGKTHRKESGNKSEKSLWQEFLDNHPTIASTRFRDRVHKPDKESVRGDWVMNFRGVTFKAFDSEPASNSESVFAQYTFKEEDFMNPITNSAMNIGSDIYDDKGRIKNTATKPYIWNIAEQIAKVVPTDTDDIKIEVHNINPRWQILEYGGYTSKENGPWIGSGKYGVKHGITSDGFSFQAPRGFKRIVDAQYNAILSKSALYNKKRGNGEYGNASAYTRGNRSLDWNIDISKMDSNQFSALMDKLTIEDGTLAIDKIHTIDGTKVWKWEKAR